ncbi:MAG: hypothetical protein WAN63_10910 [Candidatus Sulfotelmatobacter sp.]
MSKVAMVAALEREVNALVRNWTRVRREHEGRTFTFFERGDTVVICGGIGLTAARRAAEAVIALYRPVLIQSIGFAGALDGKLHVGDLFSPTQVLDARDGSRTQLLGGQGTLVTFMSVAGAEQKAKLARAYGARAVDMEAAEVATAAHAHGIPFGAIKVISDELDFEMPRMADFIDSEGRFQTTEFIFFAALRPWLWGRVAVLASNSTKAARALAKHGESFSNELVSTTSTGALPSGGRK